MSSANTIPLDLLRRLQNEPLISSFILNAARSGADVSPLAQLFLLLIARNGCRPGELLAVHCTDILSDGMLLVRGNKRSASRVITLFPYTSVIGVHTNQCRCRLFPWSVSQIYTLANRCSLRAPRSTSSKTSRRFSLFRAQFISKVSGSTKDERVIADAVGHRSIKSQRYYL